MRRSLALLWITTTGCVAWDEQIVYDTAEPAPDERPDPGDRPDDPEPRPDGPIWLSPDGAAPGEARIVSLLSDGPDLSTVASLAFYGDGEIEVVASAPRDPGEVILTLSVPEGAPASDNHLLVTFADGDTLFVEDAFAVIPAPE